MLRAIRRLLLLALIGLTVRAASQRWRERSELGGRSLEAPSWPPHQELATAHDEVAAPAAATVAAPSHLDVVDTPSEPATADAPVRWRAAVDGGCPDGFPVKVNERSGIFHVPGGRFYARTVAERCYATPEDALADGYRAAKA